MGLEEKIRKVNISYKENTQQCQKYREGIKVFDEMIRDGVVQKRGNQLALPDELYARRLEYNNCSLKY